MVLFRNVFMWFLHCLFADAFSYRGGVDGAGVILFCGGSGKEAEKLIQAVLVVSADGAGAAADGFAGQIEVLADMAGIDQEVFGGL